MSDDPAHRTLHHPSPLMTLPGAVTQSAPAPAGSGNPRPDQSTAAADPDRGMAWHYGDPLAEQHAAERGAVVIDGWNAEFLTVTGDDRLTWLHSLSTQYFEDVADGTAAEALWLSPQGRIEHWADVTELDGTMRLRVEPGDAAALGEFLRSMIFWSKVAVPEDTGAFGLLTVAGPQGPAVVTRALGGPDTAAPPAAGHARALTDGPGKGGWLRAFPDRIDVVVPRASIGVVVGALVAAGARPAGTWADAALRVAARRPRFGRDNDERTIPNETPWLTTAVHLDKGCYRGQETVARTDNLGAPPRRLVLLNLDGSGERLPTPGEAIHTAEGRVVGRLGTVAQHWQDGPIALALVKRTIGPDTPLVADGVDALVDPDDAPVTGRATSIDRRAFPRFAGRSASTVRSR